MHKEIIEVEVIKSDVLEYKPKGMISYKCLCCEHRTEIILKGLSEDLSITPIVKTRWWWEGERRVIRKSEEAKEVK